MRRWVALLLCWTASLVGVERVLDGDTIEVELQIWPKVTITEKVRVLAVDTPEREDLIRWRAARDFTEGWLRTSGATDVTVCKYDSFGRALGKVVSKSQGDLGAALIIAGHGVLYERK